MPSTKVSWLARELTSQLVTKGIAVQAEVDPIVGEGRGGPRPRPEDFNLITIDEKGYTESEHDDFGDQYYVVVVKGIKINIELFVKAAQKLLNYYEDDKQVTVSYI